MKSRSFNAVFALLFCFAVTAAEQPAGELDRGGRLKRLYLENGWVDVSSRIVVPKRGWTEFPEFSEQVQASQQDGRTVWRGTVKHTGGTGFEIAQTASNVDGKLVLDIEARALGDDPIEGVILFIDLPTDRFAGGSYELGSEKGNLPKDLPDPYHLASGQASRLVFVDAKKQARIELECSPAAKVGLQDGRKWGKSFNALINVHAGPMTKGQTARLRVALRAEGTVDTAPANLSLDARKVQYVLAGGIGGNYCFNIDSPITRHTLDHLRVAWGRTEMTLRDLKPFDAADGAAVRRQLEEADQPGKRTRQELEIMAELSKRKIPYATSIWRLPPWMYDAPEKESQNHIATDRWPHLLTAVGEYLTYAKEKHQAEPLSFSFNEPDCGARVGFSPEAHRDALKKFGAHFEKLGLKTRLLLGDVCNPRGTVKFLQPALNDPEALKYCNVVSYHSWGGAKPGQYAEWAALGEKLKRPVIVAEAGPDADAWRGARYRELSFAALEMVHYQELFLYARPHAILRWEYTGDYGLLDQEKNRLVPTFRYALQKHFTEFCPAGSEALATTSDSDAVLLTAFRWKDGDKTHYGLHLSNGGWARPCTLSGLPKDVTAWTVLRSRNGELFKQIPAVDVKDGKATLELPAESLTTFTTAALPELE
jgi:O-glycosyl hydrolase